jgi:DNA polymerase/3'-5' exonuclease PolX
LPYEGVMRAGRIVAAETEEEIFRAIGVEYVKPEHRER